jgi:hypothetical protein
VPVSCEMKMVLGSPSSRPSPPGEGESFAGFLDCGASAIGGRVSSNMRRGRIFPLLWGENSPKNSCIETMNLILRKHMNSSEKELLVHGQGQGEGGRGNKLI